MSGNRDRVKAFAPIFFLAISVVAQIIGFSAALFLGKHVAIYLPNSIFFVQLFIHLVIVFSILRWQKLPISWQLINIALPVFLQFQLPWQLFAALTFVALLVYLPTFWTRVPYYPTNRRAYDGIAEILPDHQSFTMIDLGCGFGALLAYLAKVRPNGNFVGVEIGPLPFIIARLRFLFKPNIKIQFRNFWGISLQHYDYVYAFLAPHPMEMLWQKFCGEAHNEATFITNSFAINQKPDQVVQIDCPRQPQLLIFHKPKRSSKGNRKTAYPAKSTAN